MASKDGGAVVDEQVESEESDWDDWSNQMIMGGSGEEGSHADSRTSPSKDAPVREMTDDEWAQQMTEASIQSVVTKEEHDPVWREMARLAEGLIVCRVETLPQMEVLMRFLSAHSPRTDYLLAATGHFLYKEYTWYIMRTGLAIVAVACAKADKTSLHISVFSPNPAHSASLLASIITPRCRSVIFWAADRDCVASMARELGGTAASPSTDTHPVAPTAAAAASDQGPSLPLPARFAHEWTHPCQLYVLPASTPIADHVVGELVTEGIVLDWVRPADVPIINDLWPYRSAKSIDTITAIARSMPCVCARTVADGKPACWMVTYHYGSIGMLHTLESHRRQGLARAVVLALCNHLRIVRPGMAPFCHIIDDNTPSRALFESMGFVRRGTADWAEYRLPRPEGAPVKAGVDG
eukprot:m.21031 g.21031  ORF g.21031 m.21031 type:complete len:410 (+) comp7984_c1_seq1:45-1274(+)